MRRTTEKRVEELVKEFRRMLTSGADYTTDYMYEKAAQKVYLSAGTAGNIVRRYYRNNVITDGMKGYYAFLEDKKLSKKIELFAENFYLCKREARLILRYLSYEKTRG